MDFQNPSMMFKQLNFQYQKREISDITYYYFLLISYSLALISSEKKKDLKLSLNLEGALGRGWAEGRILTCLWIPALVCLSFPQI